MRFSQVLTVLLLVLAFLQYTWFAPQLPEQIASHFDAAGRADGWSSKGDFFALNLAFVVGMALLFLGLTAWLAPERRAATLETLQQQMEWLAAATMALMVSITQLTIQVNLAGGRRVAAGHLLAVVRRLYGLFHRVADHAAAQMVR